MFSSLILSCHFSINRPGNGKIMVMLCESAYIYNYTKIDKFTTENELLYIHQILIVVMYNVFT